MLSLSPVEFEQFIMQLSFQKAENARNGSHKRTLILATPKKGVHLVLSLREFEKLSRMADLAEAEIEALAMMELF